MMIFNPSLVQRSHDSLVQADMHSHSNWVRECLQAVLAYVRLLTSVDALVGGEMRRIRECLVAELALEWLLPRVNALVDGEVR